MFKCCEPSVTIKLQTRSLWLSCLQYLPCFPSLCSFYSHFWHLISEVFVFSTVHIIALLPRIKAGDQSDCCRFLQEPWAAPDWDRHWLRCPVLSDGGPARPDDQRQPGRVWLQLPTGETLGGGSSQHLRRDHLSLHWGVSSTCQVRQQY